MNGENGTVSERTQRGAFHLVCRRQQGAAVINALTGAWLGGAEPRIRELFDHLTLPAGQSPPLPPHLLEMLEQSGIADPPSEPPKCPPSLCVVHVGHACNLACEYCYAPKDTGRISPEVIARTCTFLGAVHGDLFVQFMGGEPLLFLPEIKETIESLREPRRGCQTTYGIQTNGLHLLDEGVLPFLKAHDVHFGLSFDGPQGMSRGRYGSQTAELERRFEELVVRLKDAGCEFGVLAVINRHNVGRLEELLDWCLDRGIPRLLINYLLLRQNNRDLAIDETEASRSLQTLFRAWVDGGLYRKLEIENFRALEDNLTDLHRSYMCRKYPCGAGREQLAVNTNGDIFPCDYLTGQREFVLGNVRFHTLEEIFGSPLMVQLRRETALPRLTDCGQCMFLSICGHCIGSSFFHGCGVSGPRSSCMADRLLIEDMLFELLCNSEYSSYVVSR